MHKQMRLIVEKIDSKLPSYGLNYVKAYDLSESLLCELS